MNFWLDLRRLERFAGAFIESPAVSRYKRAIMEQDAIQPLEQITDLRHRVRRLHWFSLSFKHEMQALGQRYAFTFAINDRALVEAFFNWATGFERERVGSTRNRRDFAVFAGGLMLRELLHAAPAKSTGRATAVPMIPPDPMAPIIEFWPEGYLYTHYCLTLVRAILEQDFDVHPAPNPQLEDLRTWQSFRENYQHDPVLAVAFFDVFMGVEPNWIFPESFLSRPAVRAKAGSLAAPNSARSGIRPIGAGKTT
jgi:hypothetical protein